MSCSQRMVGRCDGMFLWMRMLEDQLYGGMNVKKLKDVIGGTPTKIDQLYDRNWNRIANFSESDSKRAYSQAFSLNMYSVMPVSGWPAMLLVELITTL